MNERHDVRRPAIEQTPIADAIAARPAASPLWTRAGVTAEVAAGWLCVHPEYKITSKDLSKFVQQLVTELLQTGRQRGRNRLAPHVQSLLRQVGVETDDFAAARTATIRGDLPRDEALVFGRLAELLAPLAVAIQLARTPVADAAAKVLAAGHPDNGLTRRELRGFVVSQVRRRAQEVHAEVGTGNNPDTYLKLILADIDLLAAAVVTAALDSRGVPATVGADATARLAAFAAEHLLELRRVARRYGSDAEDIVAQTMLKLTLALRNDPDRTLDIGYVRTALATTATDFAAKAAQRAAREMTDTEAVDREDTLRDDTLVVDAADTMLHLVLDAAAALGNSGVESEQTLARQTLLRYFLDEPEVADMRRARLAAHVLELTAGCTRGRDEVTIGLETVATSLAPNPTAARRVCRLALTALRSR